LGKKLDNNFDERLDKKLVNLEKILTKKLVPLIAQGIPEEKPWNA
jgi:hypothetical protein